MHRHPPFVVEHLDLAEHEVAAHAQHARRDQQGRRSGPRA